MTYTEFKKLKINTSSIGWEPASSDDAYFCTPKGAKIIGRAGVDGIHYCTVRKLGETIFAVSPMNLPGKYVYPIARNMEDLLRLLLACCDMNIIEQAWMWDEEQLAEQIDEVKKSEYFDPSALDAIREKCGLTPMENPYEYLYRLQKSYNYSQIPFTDEYYEMMEENAAWQPPSEWKVTMDGDFTPERGRGGKEIPLSKTFRWGNETWHIPSAYLCSGGVVVDFFAEINDASSDTPSNRVLHFLPTLVVNGSELKNKSGRGDAWTPNEYPDGGEKNPIAKWVLTHYGFDLSRTWIIRRCTFPSETKISEITSLSLKMERGREQFPGIRFTSPQVGDTLTFKHPTVGTEHTLTVQEYEPHEMDFREDDEWIFPTHCMLMRYTVTPEIPMGEMGVQDIRGGDAPRRNPSASVRAGDDFCSVIGVIRSSDGPTAVFVGAGSTAQVRSACSSLRFEKPERVDWCVEFRVKTVEDIEIELIP